MGNYIFDGINAFDSPLFIKKSATENTINALQDGVTITAIFGTVTNPQNLYDWNSQTTCFLSSGAFLTGVIIDLGAGITKTCDTLILNNYSCSTNYLTTLELQGSNNNITYTSIKSTEIAGNYDLILIKGTNSTAYRYYRVYFFNRGTGDNTIGEMVLCNSSNLIYVPMPAGVQSIVNNYSEKVAFNELIDGGFIGAITSVKYGATYGYEWLPQSDRDNLKTLKDSKTDFAVIPSPQATNEIYHVYWTNPWDFSFTDKYENAGYTGTIEVREL